MVQPYIRNNSAGAYDVDQLFWFKIDDFHRPSLTVYPNRETYEKMKKDPLIYLDKMKSVGIEPVEIREWPSLGGF